MATRTIAFGQIACLGIIALFGLSTSVRAEETSVYLDPAQPLEARVQDLISRLTLEENAPAMVEAWWAGKKGGNAIADVIFGDVNPGGRLPDTVYRLDDQVLSQQRF